MKKITADTLFDLTFVSAPLLSPDGKLAAFVASHADRDSNSYPSDIWLASESGSRRLTSGGDAHGFCWTPEGNILFSAARTDAEKASQKKGERITYFYDISPCGGEAQPAFSLPYKAGGLKHLRGSEYLFTDTFDSSYPSLDGLDSAAQEKALSDWRSPSYRSITGLSFRFNGAGWTEGVYSRLGIYDREHGVSRIITPEGADVGGVSYADGKLYIILSPADSFDAPGSCSLHMYDLDTGEDTVLYNADGITELGFAEPRADGLILIAANRGEVYGRNQTEILYTLDPQKPDVLTPVGGGVPYEPGSAGSDARFGGGQTHVMRGSDLIYAALSRYSSELRCVAPDGTVTVLGRAESIDSFDISADRSVIVTSEFRDGTPAEIYFNGKKVTSFGDFLADAPKPEHFTFKASDGCEIDGWVIRPVDHTAGVSCPALLEIHGGPRTAYGETFFHEMQMFAAAGYFVFFCNPRGSDGRGDAFADIWGGYGERDYLDIMEFADAALAREPDADPKRFGVLGGSYGGYMTNWIIGHTDRFAAACSQRSIASWSMFEHSSDIGGVFTLAQHKAVTATDRDYLWQISPLKYAAGARTPTLFIHSDEDWRCPLSEGIAMYTAMRRNGAEAKICIFSGENHELSRSGAPRNRISRLSEMLDWFGKYLR